MLDGKRRNQAGEKSHIVYETEVWKWEDGVWTLAGAAEARATQAVRLPAMPGLYRIDYRPAYSAGYELTSMAAADLPAEETLWTGTEAGTGEQDGTETDTGELDGTETGTGVQVGKTTDAGVQNWPGAEINSGVHNTREIGMDTRFSGRPDSGLNPQESAAELGRYPAPFSTTRGVRWGYIDRTGRTAIDPIYDYAEPFQKDGQAVIQLGGFSGRIDAYGRETLKPVYSYIGPTTEGRTVVSDDKGYFLLDEQGRPLTRKRYSYLNPVKEGRALFNETAGDGSIRYGYLGSDGAVALPAVYLDGGDFMDGKALVQTGQAEFALIDRNGKRLQTYRYPFVGSRGDGYLAFQAKENGPYGYLHENGTVLISPRFTQALPFEDGRAVVNTAADYGSQYGLIDSAGRFVIPPRFSDIQQLGEKRVAAGTAIDPEKPYLGSRYAIYDAVSGAELNPGPYLTVNRYEQGLASVSDAGWTFFIDRSGKPAAQPPRLAGSGTLTLEDGLIRADVDRRTSYYNRAGRLVWKQNTVIPLRPPYLVEERKYKPNPDVLIYYPEVRGIRDPAVAQAVNKRLREMSLAGEAAIPNPGEASYNGDFSVHFFRKQLLVLELEGYTYPFGAAHGMPTRDFAHIDLKTGEFYRLEDLFKPGSDYVKKLSAIVGERIKNDPQYSYVFPDSYKGIAPDQPFYVDEEALTLYFAPYEIAPYAAGFPSFRIPYAEIMGLIRTEGPFWQSYH